jgi:hypothetical protein
MSIGCNMHPETKGESYLWQYKVFLLWGFIRISSLKNKQKLFHAENERKSRDRQTK